MPPTYISGRQRDFVPVSVEAQLGHKANKASRTFRKMKPELSYALLISNPNAEKKTKKPRVSLNCNAALGKDASRSVTRSVYHKGSVRRRCSSLGKLSPAALEASCLGRSDVSSAIIPDASHGVVISINSSPSLNHRLPSAACLLDRHTH